MKVLLIKKRATKEEIRQMLVALTSYIKLAVDIKNEVLAGDRRDCAGFIGVVYAEFRRD